MTQHKKDKGNYMGSCNRTSCQKPGAEYFNHSTRAYYCQECAEILNRENHTDAQRLYGHELCTKGLHITDPNGQFYVPAKGSPTPQPAQGEGKPFNLPEHKGLGALKRDLTPLEQFIWDWEPSGEWDSADWRQKLSAAISASLPSQSGESAGVVKTLTYALREIAEWKLDPNPKSDYAEGWNDAIESIKQDAQRVLDESSGKQVGDASGSLPGFSEEQVREAIMGIDTKHWIKEKLADQIINQIRKPKK